MLRIVLSLMLTLTSFIQGQLSVTWNGSIITGPVLIYLDEILVDNYTTAEIGNPNRPGALICRSEDRARVSWHFTTGTFVSDAPRSDSRTFIQTRTGEGAVPSMSRLSLSREEVVATTIETNGVWHCRLNAVGGRDSHSNSGFEEQVNVGIFFRGGALGSITSNQVSLTSSSFESNPPTFTLTGDTRGGPPTTYTWTRNDQVITDGGPYSISIAVNGHSETVYYQSRYRSTLTVTGHLPGLYQYSVTNRATTTTVNSNTSIQGAASPVVTTSLLTATSVTVSWTQPPFSFTPVGYTVTLTRVTGSGQVLCSEAEDSRTIVNISATLVEFTSLQEFSVYNTTVIALFSEYSTVFLTNTSFTTLSAAPTGAPRDAVFYVTSTSVNVSWTAIECIDRNGVITGYEVEFQEQGGARIPGEVVNETFTASRLTPHTNYTFRVAGVNSNGTGPFSELTIIQTNKSEFCVQRCSAQADVPVDVYERDVSLAVILTLLLTVTFHTAIMFGVFYARNFILKKCSLAIAGTKSQAFCCCVNRDSSVGAIHREKEAVYEEEDEREENTAREDMVMEENTAYGQITTS